VSDPLGDIEAFLGRLVRLDTAALVRIRSTPNHATLWGRVPWDVLVSRTVSASFGPTDLVVRAADWLVHPAGPTDVAALSRVDSAWRVPLPPDERQVIEAVPAATLRSLGAAAAETLRSAASGGVGGRAVGQRAVRDALLDHIAIVVSAGERRVEIPQRVVQAVVRMDFAGGDESVRVLGAGAWIGLAARYGTAWWRPSTGLALTPTRSAHRHG